MRYFTIKHTCCGVVGCNSGVVCNCGIAGFNDDIVDRCRDIVSCGIISFDNIVDCCEIVCSIGCCGMIINGCCGMIINGRCGMIGCSGITGCCGIIGCCDLTNSCGINGCCDIIACCEFAWVAIPLLCRYIWF